MKTEPKIRGEKRVDVADILFDVETKPVYAGKSIYDRIKGFFTQDAQQINNRVAVCVKGTNRILGVMSDQYEPVTNKLIHDTIATQVIADGVWKMDTYANWNQGIFRFELTNFAKTIMIGKHEAHPRVLITNSMTGRTGVHCNFGAFIVVCSNGNWIGKKLAFRTIKHLGNPEDGVNAIIKDAFECSKDDSIYERWNRWTTEHWNGVIKDPGRLPKNVLTILTDLTNIGQTKWQVFNTVTAMLTKKGYVGRSIDLQAQVEAVLN